MDIRRRIEPKTIEKIVENHQHWINEDCDNWQTMKANFSYMDLSGINLSKLNLIGANFSDTRLIDADLSGADLSYTNFSGASLCHAKLLNATFLHANLSNADFTEANLSGAVLARANLSESLFYDADLYHACFDGTILSNAAFINTECEGATFLHANCKENIFIVNTKIPETFTLPISCPSEGSFIGWKKAKSGNYRCHQDVIVKLEIPEDAKRTSAAGRKCRCDKAKVLAIYYMDGNEAAKAYSAYNRNFVYLPGDIVIADRFDEDRWNECSHGIHFFITREEAENFSI